jgi:hypothetical protein
MSPRAREEETGRWSRAVKGTRCERREDGGKGNGRKGMSNKRKRVSNRTKLCEAKSSDIEAERTSGR